MNYTEALDYIDKIVWTNCPPTLERIRILLDGIGNPERQLRFLHIAGTNGKGSTAAMLAAVLERAGYRTGMFTSPFLHRYNERMQVNRVEIADALLARLVERIQPVADAMTEKPTEFELTTALGLLFFAELHCDIVVLEVGLGGRLDSTNQIPPPVAAIVTAIGLEHTELLGDTVEKIAREKAGIFKTGSHAVVSEQAENILAVFREVAAEQKISLEVAPLSRLTLLSASAEGQQVEDKRYGQFRLPLLGSHQLQNCATVLTTVDFLRESGWEISDEAVTEGLSHTAWAGRLELLSREPLFFVDGGHNPQCARTIGKTFGELFPDKKVIFVAGMLADKDSSGILSPIVPVAKRFFTVTPPSSRAMSAAALADLLETKYHIPAAPCPSVTEGIRAALAAAAAEDIICAFGSLYMVGEVRDYFLK